MSYSHVPVETKCPKCGGFLGVLGCISVKVQCPYCERKKMQMKDIEPKVGDRCRVRETPYIISHGTIESIFMDDELQEPRYIVKIDGSRIRGGYLRDSIEIE